MDRFSILLKKKPPKEEPKKPEDKKDSTHETGTYVTPGVYVRTVGFAQGPDSTNQEYAQVYASGTAGIAGGFSMSSSWGGDASYSMNPSNRPVLRGKEIGPTKKFLKFIAISIVGLYVVTIATALLIFLRSQL